MTQTLLYLVPAIGLLTLFYTYIQFKWVDKQTRKWQNEKILNIADGAMAFLKAEYKVLSYFVIIVALLLAVMSMGNENSYQWLD